jgi:hypothetical protein
LDVEPLEQTPAVRREYYARLAEALRRLPEVEAAGAIDDLALEGGGQYGSPRADTGVNIGGMQYTVLPGYLEAMAVRPLAGRLFEDSDRAAGDAMIVNAALSKQHFGGAAVGHTMRSMGRNARQWRIVGVSRIFDTADHRIASHPRCTCCPILTRRSSRRCRRRWSCAFATAHPCRWIV